MKTEYNIHERTLAFAIARHHVKDKLRSEGLKISSFKPTEITEFAKELIAQDPRYLQRARRSLLPFD